MSDNEWDGRESKAITMEVDFDTVDALFHDDVTWSIVHKDTVSVYDDEGKPVLDEHGEQTYATQQTEFDNSEYSIRDDLTVHVDGTCTVKMGKPTDLESAYELMYGGM